jgi:CDP-glucose 4,6-dehydratase
MRRGRCGNLTAREMAYYRGKRVLVTGHTGFKGSWLCCLLDHFGADVAGYALEPPTEPNLYTLTFPQGRVRDHRGDIRDLDALAKVFEDFQPEVVLHLAAQPIVRDSYRRPVYTYETNVMGTVNVLECVRNTKSVRSFLNVTTDKVYQNNEWVWGYRENEPLDGFDPYSNSKSCSELVTHCYQKSYFQLPDAPAISTARAGNVIGGGDMAPDRILPDCIRAAAAGQAIQVRNPYSIRPYQHVLESLATYLLIAATQATDPAKAGWYNVGPNESDYITTGRLVDLFVRFWGEGIGWVNGSDGGPHEARLLKLDCSKLKDEFQWSPRWNIEQAVEQTCAWAKVWLAGGDVKAEMDREIDNYFKQSEM